MANLAVKMQQIASNAQIQVQQLANESTEKSFVYNREEANTARSWQKMMSDTSHQREVEDLKKAGLNPVLSANGGAQSYTTSSASAQANDPSGSIANLAAQQMSGIAQGYSADKSASATRYAAKVSAAATRAAAAATASAARYAASMQYLNQREHEKWQTGYLKDVTKSKIEIANSTPAKSVGAVLDKLAQKSGLYDLVGTNTVKGIVGKAKLLLNDPKKFFKEVPQGGKIMINNFKLNSNGINLVDNQLKKMGLKANKTNRNAFIKAIVFGSGYHLNYLAYSIPRPNRSTLR